METLEVMDTVKMLEVLKILEVLEVLEILETLVKSCDYHFTGLQPMSRYSENISGRLDFFSYGGPCVMTMS